MMHPSDSDSWIFTRAGTASATCDDAYLANGCIGLRVGPHGFGTRQNPSRGLIAGLRYGQAPCVVGQSASKHQPMVHLPDATCCGFIVDGQNVLGHPAVTQEFDIYKAELRTHIKCEACEIFAKLLVNYRRKNLIQQEVEILPHADCVMNVDMSVEDSHAIGVDMSYEEAGYRRYAISGDGNGELHITAAVWIDGHVCEDEKISLNLKRGRVVRIRKLAAIGKNEKISLPDDFDLSADEHYDAWRTLWASRVEVQERHWSRMLNMAQYCLKASHRDDNIYSVAPMGLSGDAWNGYVFPWDACLWILPYYQLTAPAQARAMLDFERSGDIFGIPRLEYYASGEGIKMYEPGCIAFAVWQHYLITGDIEWLGKKGMGLILAACEGYRKRAELNPQSGLYEIHHVWPADEFASKDSSNNAFTNAIAGLTFDICKTACEKLAALFPEKYRDIQSRKFVLPFDAVNRRHIEYDGYDGHEIKQADTNLLTWPLGLIGDKSVMRNNLEYYSSRVSHNGTPEMTWGAYFVIASKLGDAKLAEAFRGEFNDFLRGDYMTSHETRDNDNTIFLTGCADMLSAFYYGAAGLKICDGDEPVFTPPLCNVFGKINVCGLYWRGRRYSAEICGQEIKITKSAQES